MEPARCANCGVNYWRDDWMELRCKRCERGLNVLRAAAESRERQARHAAKQARKRARKIELWTDGTPGWQPPPMPEPRSQMRWTTGWYLIGTPAPPPKAY